MDTQIQRASETITGLGRLMAEVQNQDIECLQNPYYMGVLGDAVSIIGVQLEELIHEQQQEQHEVAK